MRSTREWREDVARAAIENRNQIMVASDLTITSNKEVVMEYLSTCDKAIEQSQINANIYAFVNRQAQHWNSTNFISRMLKRMALILAKIDNLRNLANHFLIRYEGDGFHEYDHYECHAICMRDHLLRTLQHCTVELDDEGQMVKEEMITILQDMDIPPIIVYVTIE